MPVRLLLVLSFLIASPAFARISAKRAEMPDFLSFQTDVYPSLRRNCAQCHSSEAVDPHGPDHSDKDPRVAYPIFRKLIDFKTPESSKFIKRLRNFHFCRDYEVNCGKEEMIRAEIEPKVIKWAVENRGDADTSTSSEFTVPKDDNFQAVFDLPSSAGGNLKVSMAFHKLQDDVYEISANRVSGESGTFRLKGMHLLMNGRRPTAATGFELLDLTMTFNPWAGAQTRTTSVPLILEKPQVILAPDDKLSLNLELAPIAEARACTNLDMFSRIVLPALIDGRLGEQDWVGFTNAEIKSLLATPAREALSQRLCQAYEQRINPLNLSRSVLFATLNGTYDAINDNLDLWLQFTRSAAAKFKAMKVRSVAITHAYGESDRRRTGKCAIDMTGSAFCWGYFQNIIDRGLSYEPGPTEQARLPLKAPARQFALSSSFYCVLLETGEVDCWGQNGGSGTEPILNGRASPYQLYTAPIKMDFFDRIAPDVIAEISVGSQHACALSRAGRVYCWGSNRFGQLGLEKTQSPVNPDTSSEPPQAAPLPERVKAISTGANHTCAAGESGKVYCWGYGSSGLLGVPDTQIKERNPSGYVSIGTVAGSISTLAPIAIPERVASLTSSSSATCALTEIGHVYCFGYNNRGQLGLETTESVIAPPRVTLFKKPVRALDLQGSTACATTTDGELHCWGVVGYQHYVESTLSEVRGVYSGSMDRARIRFLIPAKTPIVGGIEICTINGQDELYCWDGTGESQGIDLKLYNKLIRRNFDLGLYTRVLLAVPSSLLGGGAAIMSQSSQ